MAKKKKKAITKNRGNAEKRLIQSKKAYLRNHSEKSRIATFRKKLAATVKGIETAEKKGEDSAELRLTGKELLSKVHSLLDKAQKRGLFKKGKVQRLKSNSAKSLIAKA